MYIDPSVAALLQHSISGTGNFTGVEVGRASRTMGTGAAAVTVLATKLGAAGNSFHVQLVNPGGTVAQTRTRWVDSTHLKVYLRRSSLAILATAQEVADAINATPGPPGVVDACVMAYAGGTDPVLAAADAALDGGLNPVTQDAEHRMLPAANVHGGLFFFGHDDAVEVLQVTGRFPGLGGATALKVQIVHLGPGNVPIETEAFTFFTASLDGTTADFFCDKRPILGPRQAVRVLMAAPGVVQVLARRAERPYLGA